MKFHKDLISSFRVILLADKQTDKQTDTGETRTSLSEVMIFFSPVKPSGVGRCVKLEVWGVLNGRLMDGVGFAHVPGGCAVSG